MLRSILICPAMQTVCEVYITSGLEGIYYALGKTDPMFSGVVECVQVGRKADLWICEEANLHEGRPVWSFCENKFAGSALILYHNDEGESVSVPDFITPEVIQAAIQWTDLETTGDFSEPHYEDHPESFVYVMGKPIYRERASL